MSIQNHDLKSIVERLVNEYAQLRQIWQEFSELYSSATERVDLMNDVAPVFFRLVQDLMIEAMVIRMTRITDKEQTGKHLNLTLRRIPAALPTAKSEFAGEIEALIESAYSKADLVRDWRSKRIAHLDYQREMSTERQPFEISYRQLRESIEAIHTVLNRTSMIVWDTELAADISMTGGTATALIKWLIDGRNPE